MRQKYAIVQSSKGWRVYESPPIGNRLKRLSRWFYHYNTALAYLVYLTAADMDREDKRISQNELSEGRIS